MVFTEDKNLRIRARKGTLVERLGTSIATGTTVSTSDGLIKYTIGSTNIPAGVTEMFLTAFCQTVGSAGNLNVGQLNTFSIPANDVEITNLFPISNGSDGETDFQFRNRIINTVRGGDNSRAKVIAAAGSVPGVKGVAMLDTAFGIAHPALVISGAGKVGAGIINAVQSIITGLLPFGTTIRVLEPKYITVDLDLVVDIKDTQSKQAIESNLVSIARNAIIGTGLGSNFNISDIDGLLTRGNSNVLDLKFIKVKLDGQEFGANIITLNTTEQLIPGNITVTTV